MAFLLNAQCFCAVVQINVQNDFKASMALLMSNRTEARHMLISPSSIQALDLGSGAVLNSHQWGLIGSGITARNRSSPCIQGRGLLFDQRKCGIGGVDAVYTPATPL